MKLDSIQQLLMVQFEQLVAKLKYDFLYEDDIGKLLCQVVKRDDDGGILATPLSFHVVVDEEKGTGEFTFYNSQGAFKKQNFNVFEQDSLINVLLYVQERLSINQRRN